MMRQDVSGCVRVFYRIYLCLVLFSVAFILDSDLDPDPESLKLELKIRAVPLMYKISDALVRYCPMSKCPSDEMTAGRQLAALLAASAFLRA